MTNFLTEAAVGILSISTLVKRRNICSVISFRWAIGFLFAGCVCETTLFFSQSPMPVIHTYTLLEFTLFIGMVVHVFDNQTRRAVHFVMSAYIVFWGAIKISGVENWNRLDYVSSGASSVLIILIGFMGANVIHAKNNGITNPLRDPMFLIIASQLTYQIGYLVTMVFAHESPSNWYVQVGYSILRNSVNAFTLYYLLRGTLQWKSPA